MDYSTGQRNTNSETHNETVCKKMIWLTNLPHGGYILLRIFLHLYKRKGRKFGVPLQLWLSTRRQIFLNSLRKLYPGHPFPARHFKTIYICLCCAVFTWNHNTRVQQNNFSFVLPCSKVSPPNSHRMPVKPSNASRYPFRLCRFSNLNEAHITKISMCAGMYIYMRASMYLCTYK
jgi:hypothetical protein